MKRFLTALLCILVTLAMILSLAACDDVTTRKRKSKDRDDDDDEKTSDSDGYEDGKDAVVLPVPNPGDIPGADSATPDGSIDSDHSGSVDGGHSGSSDGGSSDGGHSGSSNGGHSGSSNGGHSSSSGSDEVISYDEFVFRQLPDGNWEVCGIKNIRNPHLVLPTTHKGAAVTKTSISAFQCYNEFQTITIPGNIKVVDTSSFQQCDGVTTLIFKEGVERLGDSTFQACDLLHTVVIPKSLTDLGRGSFGGSDALTSVFYEGSDIQWRATFGERRFNDYTTVYFYSETSPGDVGNYWHYVGGTPTVW